MKLGDYDYVGLDTETTGLRYPDDRAFCVGIATPDGRTFSYDFRSGEADAFRRDVESFSGTYICHNASFDYRMLHAAGVVLPIERFDCTAVRATLVYEHEALRYPPFGGAGSFQLDDLAKKYLGESKTTDIYAELAAIFGGIATRNVQIGRISKAPWEVVKPYVEKDALLALRLWEYQETRRKAEDLTSIMEFERGLMPLVIRTTMSGVRVDLDQADRAMAELTPVLNETQSKLDKLAGRKLNVNSAKQIREMFQPKQSGGDWYVGDYKIGTTPKGQPSIAGEYLQNMPDPRAQLIGEIRSLIKTRDTFLAKHIIDHSIGGRVYPSINQTKGEDGGTGTGRFSYTDPALQQIPSRNKKVAAIVKPCFLPDEGETWVDSDLASFEVRIFAHLVAAFDGRIAERYAADPTLDFHQFVADLTGLVRNATRPGEANAKQLNLSMIFCQGNGATAQKMGLPWSWDSFTAKDGAEIKYQKAGDEAMRVINKYHKELPGVSKLADQAKKIVNKNGYIRTRHGRKLRFPGGYKDYKSSGLLIQSTAADENKENWLRIDRAIGGDGRLILNTHDSYGLSLPGDWKPKYERVKNAVERDTLRVPILLDFNGAGPNWWAALQGD